MADELKSETILSHYRIVSRIGAGGMGEVYLAQDIELGRNVALKILLPEIASNEDRVQRFIQEAKAASALNHPNILTVYEIGAENESRYISTEYISGKTLREHWRSTVLTLNEMLDIAIQVAAALNAAHGAGIVHRDIKPENIMIREDGLAKVLDFGLAKLVEKSSEIAAPEDQTRAQLNTQPGVIMGTAAYMSPEQARSQKLDARSDIFSFGIVLYEMLAGKRPFQGEESVDLISSILKDDPPSLRQFSSELPRQLERIVDKTLRKDRGQRYQHIKDLLIDLEDLRDELKFEAKLGKSVEVTRPESVHVTDADPRRSTLSIPAIITKERSFTILHVIAVLAVAAGLLGATWWLVMLRASPAKKSVEPKRVELATWSSSPGELFSSASFSPDGKLIAFSSTRSGTKNVWVTQTTSTSQAIQVTNDTFSNIDPIWSPAGDEIAFISQKRDTRNSETNSTGIWRVSALGGSPRSVGPVADGSFELRRWTTSGKIYFQSVGELFAMDISTGLSQKISSFNGKSINVKWVTISADEKKIAYELQNENSWQLVVSDVANTNPKVVIDLQTQPNSIIWLPERSRFYYTLISDNAFQTYLLDDGNRPVQITVPDGDGTVVDSSPDGDSIIVSSAKEESSLWRVSMHESREFPVSRSINAELFPSVSPDGSRIVFQSAKNLSRGSGLFDSSIMVKTMASKDEPGTQLSSSGSVPEWSPEGSLVAYLRKNNDVFDLFVANSNGGGERKLTTGGITAFGYAVSPYNLIQTKVFAWSPDSSSIAYTAELNGVSNIWLVDVRDGTVRPITEVTPPGYKYYCPIWSSDGTKLAFFAKFRSSAENESVRNILGIYDRTANKTSFVMESDRNFRLIGWTADEKGLVIAEPSVVNALPPETKIERVSVEDGKISMLVDLKRAYYYNIFLSADRKFIAYAARESDIDDIRIVADPGREPRKLTDNNDPSMYFSRLTWLHDGSAIVFGKQTRFSLLSIISNLD